MKAHTLELLDLLGLVVWHAVIVGMLYVVVNIVN